MLENIKNFTTTILFAVMTMIVIKMIVPDGKNKKYILFVCGLITTIVLMEPILKFMKLDINEVLAKNQVEYDEYKADESLYQNAIKESYEKTLINDVISRLKENGYNVGNVRIEYDKTSYKPSKMYLDLEDEEGYVQPVKIEVSNQSIPSQVNEVTKSKIQEIIKLNYGIEKNNIFIERSNQ